MSSRSTLLREMFLLAGAIGILFVLVVVGALVFSNSFSWLWLARIILAGALVCALFEGIMLVRATRVSHALTPFSTWRRIDQARGCSLALLFGIVTFGLLLCGVLMEWLVEWR